LGRGNQRTGKIGPETDFISDTIATRRRKKDEADIDNQQTCFGVACLLSRVRCLQMCERARRAIARRNNPTLLLNY
jgi:hypothetical protein